MVLFLALASAFAAPDRNETPQSPLGVRPDFSPATLHAPGDGAAWPSLEASAARPSGPDASDAMRSV